MQFFKINIQYQAKLQLFDYFITP